MIFDTHAHYDDRAFDGDREELLGSLLERGIGRAVNIACSLSSIRRTLELTEKYPYLYGAAGVHPTDTGELGEENFGEIGKALAHPKIVALGEIGLDYHWDAPERPVQKKWFERQLALARETGMPVVLHSRDAAKDTLEMVKSAGGIELSAVMHCFSYGVELAREYLNMGYYLGVGGVITFANGRRLKEVVSYMPMDRLLLETDCPYLAPVPFRGKRNSSLNLPYVVRAVAEIKGITEAEVERITWENACRFYRLSPEGEVHDWNVGEERVCGRRSGEEVGDSEQHTGGDQACGQRTGEEE
ncbi:MAG: TatD family hydrolase [Lachnospiraceae bacterium]|nr:TatD family hydrolase [Lachnospiraceae bacterium]